MKLLRSPLFEKASIGLLLRTASCMRSLRGVRFQEAGVSPEHDRAQTSVRLPNPAAAPSPLRAPTCAGVHLPAQPLPTSRTC